MLVKSFIYILIQGRNRHIFLRGAKSFFLIFSQHEMLFPGSKFPFWKTQNKISVVFKSEKQTNKKKIHQQKCPGQKSLGGTLPPAPPTCYATVLIMCYKLMPTFNRLKPSCLEYLFQESINKITKSTVNIDHYHSSEMKK